MERIEIGSRNRDNPKIGQQQTILKTMERLDESDCQGCFEDGWGYMTQYMKQQPKFVQGHLGVARSLASGESTASFDSTASSTLEVKRAGGKVALAGPSDDYLPISFAAEAIFKDAPHPNAAKLFVTWYLSKDWQSRTGVYSPNPVRLGSRQSSLGSAQY